MNPTNIKIKRAELEVLEEMYDFLSEKLNDRPFREYRVVGKSDKQATDWYTKELKWEDEDKTIPMYENVYDYVTVPEDEWTEETRARKVAIEKLMAAIDKLV